MFSQTCPDGHTKYCTKTLNVFNFVFAPGNMVHLDNHHYYSIYTMYNHYNFLYFCIGSYSLDASSTCPKWLLTQEYLCSVCSYIVISHILSIESFHLVQIKDGV